MRRAVAGLSCGLVLGVSACSTGPTSTPERPVPITSAVVARPGSRVLEVPDVGGGCDVDRVELLRQDADEVQLELLRHEDQPAGGACPAVAWAGTVRVELQERLGRRRLVDAATGQGLRLTATRPGPAG